MLGASVTCVKRSWAASGASGRERWLVLRGVRGRDKG